MVEIRVETVLKTVCVLVLTGVIALLSCVGWVGAADGEGLYLSHCASCHGKEGEGFLQVYPPLVNSQYLGSEIARLPCIMRFGMKGKIIAGGREFNGIMPGNSRLSNDDLAALTNYLLVRWGDADKKLNVAEWLENCPE